MDRWRACVYSCMNMACECVSDSHSGETPDTKKEKSREEHTDKSVKKYVLPKYKVLNKKIVEYNII